MKTVKMKVEPLCPTETPEVPPLASATGRSDVTVTFTAPPGLTLAAPGLTEVISADAGLAPATRIANAAAASTNPRAMWMPARRDARDLVDRTMTPNDLDDLRRIRH